MWILVLNDSSHHHNWFLLRYLGFGRCLHFDLVSSPFPHTLTSVNVPSGLWYWASWSLTLDSTFCELANLSPRSSPNGLDKLVFGGWMRGWESCMLKSFLTMSSSSATLFCKFDLSICKYTSLGNIGHNMFYMVYDIQVSRIPWAYHFVQPKTDLALVIVPKQSEWQVDLLCFYWFLNSICIKDKRESINASWPVIHCKYIVVYKVHS